MRLELAGVPDRPAGERGRMDTQCPWLRSTHSAYGRAGGQRTRTWPGSLGVTGSGAPLSGSLGRHLGNAELEQGRKD